MVSRPTQENKIFNISLVISYIFECRNCTYRYSTFKLKPHNICELYTTFEFVFGSVLNCSSPVCPGVAVPESRENPSHCPGQQAGPTWSSEPSTAQSAAGPAEGVWGPGLVHPALLCRVRHRAGGGVPEGGLSAEDLAEPETDIQMLS